jgi:hypothetical protein
MGFTEDHVSSPATFAVGAIYGLSGACNVVLLLTTRPASVLFGKLTQSSSGRAPSPLNGEELNLRRMEVNIDGEDIGRLPSRS